MTACKHQGACVSSQAYTHCLHTLRETGLKSKASGLVPYFNSFSHRNTLLNESDYYLGTVRIWLALSHDVDSIILFWSSFPGYKFFQEMNRSTKRHLCSCGLLSLYTHKLFANSFPFFKYGSKIPVSTQGTIGFKWGCIMIFWPSWPSCAACSLAGSRYPWPRVRQAQVSNV